MGIGFRKLSSPNKYAVFKAMGLKMRKGKKMLMMQHHNGEWWTVMKMRRGGNKHLTERGLPLSVRIQSSNVEIGDEYIGADDICFIEGSQIGNLCATYEKHFGKPKDFRISPRQKGRIYLARYLILKDKGILDE